MKQRFEFLGGLPGGRTAHVLLIALAASSLAGCRSGTAPTHSAGAMSPAAAMSAAAAMPRGDTLPPVAWTGVPDDPLSRPYRPSFHAGASCPCHPASSHPSSTAAPLPHAVTGPWAPPGFSQPWPHDEYLFDGGDEGARATVSPDWEVFGLEPTDTIAHYDTLDGRRLVEPSNRVPLYAPRFGAVRKVVNPLASEQIDAPLGVEQPLHLVRYEETLVPTTSLQAEQPDAQIGRRRASGYRTHEGEGLLSTVLVPRGFQDRFMPFEDLTAIRHGLIEASEEAFLATSIDAARTWTSDVGVQVVLDHQVATEAVGDRRVQATFTVDPIPGKPMLRIIKVASTQFAQPGDEVDFTLRYDNVGTETIGNVTLIDSLTTRLEYVPDSAQSSLEADFFADPNEAGSASLRWEIRDPLPVGEGGVVRFRCRVR